MKVIDVICVWFSQKWCTFLKTYALQNVNLQYVCIFQRDGSAWTNPCTLDYKCEVCGNCHLSASQGLMDLHLHTELYFPLCNLTQVDKVWWNILLEVMTGFIWLHIEVPLVFTHWPMWTGWLLMAWHHIDARPSATIMLTWLWRGQVGFILLTVCLFISLQFLICVYCL